MSTENLSGDKHEEALTIGNRVPASPQIWRHHMSEKVHDDPNVAFQAALFEILKRFYDSAPVIDDPRKEATARGGRLVLQEFLAPCPFRNPGYGAVKLPIRLVVCDGIHCLEVGPFDFGKIDIEILRRAIAGYDDAMTVKRSPELDNAAEIDESSLQHPSGAET